MRQWTRFNILKTEADNSGQAELCSWWERWLCSDGIMVMDWAKLLSGVGLVMGFRVRGRYKFIGSNFSWNWVYDPSSCLLMECHHKPNQICHGFCLASTYPVLEQQCVWGEVRWVWVGLAIAQIVWPQLKHHPSPETPHSNIWNTESQIHPYMILLVSIWSLFLLRSFSELNMVLPAL